MGPRSNPIAIAVALTPTEGLLFHVSAGRTLEARLVRKVDGKWTPSVEVGSVDFITCHESGSSAVVSHIWRFLALESGAEEMPPADQRRQLRAANKELRAAFPRGLEV